MNRRVGWPRRTSEGKHEIHERGWIRFDYLQRVTLRLSLQSDSSRPRCNTRSSDSESRIPWESGLGRVQRGGTEKALEGDGPDGRVAPVEWTMPRFSVLIQKIEPNASATASHIPWEGSRSLDDDDTGPGWRHRFFVADVSAQSDRCQSSLEAPSLIPRCFIFCGSQERQTTARSRLPGT
jgi:hypothetical protein